MAKVVSGDLFSLECGRGNHESQGASPAQYCLLDKCEEDVCVEGALMSLIQDHDTILGQIWVHEALSNQDSVSHVFDLSLFTRLVFESDGVSHLRA